jgi:protein phosphatase-4 regulatory subunit 3
LQGRSTDGRGASDAEASGGSSGYAGADTAIQLPAAELRNAAAIADLIAEVPMFKRQRLIELILSSDYVLDLVKLFSVAEDLESAEDLQHIYHIFKGLILLNDGNLYELMLRDDLVMDVFGALEYDPEIGAGRRAEHRAFFEGGKRFKLVVPITDDAVLKKIHQNYHISFLKDVVLPRALDDNAFAALNQIVFCNNVHIVSSLANDGTFFQALRDKLANEAQEPDALLDALRLLQELCTITKQLQLYNRSTFYRKFCEHGCFAPLAKALRRPQPELRLAALEILLASTQHEPSLLRQFILGQRPQYELCNALISVLASPGGSGEKPQVTEVFRALLDPEGMEGRERDDFLNVFYEEFVDKVAQPVTGKVAAGTGPVNGDAATANGLNAAGVDQGDVDEDDVGDVLSARQHVCELLSFFVTKHTHRIKYFILRNNVLCRVLKLARASDKGLILGEPLLPRPFAAPAGTQPFQSLQPGCSTLEALSRLGSIADSPLPRSPPCGSRHSVFPHLHWAQRRIL